MPEKFTTIHTIGGELHSTPGPKSKMVTALINDNGNAGDKSRIKFQEIAVDKITPRFVNKYSQRRIDDLAQSIKNTDGRLIHPIVLVDISELPDDSEIIKAAIASGKDIKKYKYIIVSGERRFRAWKKLREEEAERIRGRRGSVNRFDTITANILTPSEAINEELYYKDANDLTRHVSAEDTIWFMKDILKELGSDEAKYNALKEMNYEGNIDRAMKYFPTYLYVAYRLKKDKGIQDWSESSIKNQLIVANNGDDKIADALLAGELPLREAMFLASLDKDQQLRLLELYKKDKERYVEECSSIKEAGDRQQKKKNLSTHADAKRVMRAGLKRAKEERKKVELIVKGLGESNSENERYIMSKYDEFIDALEKTINKAR